MQRIRFGRSLRLILAMGNAAAAVADPDEISIQEIDQYLLKHGYPTEFIQDAAEIAKRQLYADQGEFESKNTIIMPMASTSDVFDPDIFSASLYVSNLSTTEENESRKSLTYLWHWDTTSKYNQPTFVFQDFVTMRWEDEYTLIADSCLFSVVSNGTLVEKEQYLYDPTVPETIDDLIFISQTGSSLIYSCDLAKGVAMEYEIDQLDYKKMYFNRSWGLYKFDFNDFKGTFSVTIANIFDSSTNKYSSAAANYIRNISGIDVDVSFNFGLSDFGITVQPGFMTEFIKSNDSVVTYRYFN